MSPDAGRSDRSQGMDGMEEVYGSTPESGVLPESRIGRSLTIVLLVVLVVALAGVIYIAVRPPETADPFTEFYVLGPDGNASGYPDTLAVGETGTFVVGITNHEHEATDYVVVARMDGRQIAERAVTLADDESWTSPVSVEATRPGDFRIRILLYKNGNRTGEPSQWLRLYGTVRNEPSS